MECPICHYRSSQMNIIHYKFPPSTLKYVQLRNILDPVSESGTVSGNGAVSSGNAVAYSGGSVAENVSRYPTMHV